MAKKQKEPDANRLVRRSAGDMHTEDERFEVSSTGGAGRWYVTDNERHDQLGLALVFGPFGTLDEVRAAIVAQRDTPSGDSGPLPEPPPEAPASRAKARASKATAEAEAAAGSESEPEPEAEAEPEPARPIPVTRARWRKRGDDRDAIVETTHRIADSWAGHDVDAITNDLHEATVFVHADGSRGEGRAKVIAGYRSLAESTAIEGYSELDLEVDVAGDSAVVRFRYRIDGSHDALPIPTRGREIQVFTRTDGRWLLAWRTVMAEERAKPGT